jgi:exonuclease III
MKIWNIAGLRRMFRARQCLSKLFRDTPAVIALQEIHRRNILADMEQLKEIRRFYDIDYNISGISNSPEIPEKPTMGVMTLTRRGHRLDNDTQICQKLESVYLRVVDSLGIFDDPFKEGRVTTVVTQLTANVKLAVINVYVVNSKWSFERRDQRAEFMLRLQQYVAAVQECGYAIALVGDFNAVTAETDIHPEIVPIRDEVPSLSQAEQSILEEFIETTKMQQLKHKNPAIYSFYPPDRGHNRKVPHNEGFTLDFVFHKGVSHFNRLSIERCQRFDHQTLVVYVSPDGAKAVKRVNEQFGMPPESAAANGTDAKQKKETQGRRGEDEADTKEY